MAAVARRRRARVVASRGEVTAMLWRVQMRSAARMSASGANIKVAREELVCQDASSIAYEKRRSAAHSPNWGQRGRRDVARHSCRLPRCPLCW